MDLFEYVNWWAVIGCVVASMALGFLWYGPLFGKRWAALSGWGEMSPEETKAMQSEAMPGYAVIIIGSAIMSIVLQTVLGAAGYEGVGQAVIVASGLWLGFVATSTLGTAMFSRQNKELWVLNEGYVLVQMVIMAVIVGALS